MSVAARVFWVHVGCIALIAAAVALSWLVPALRAQPLAGLALVGAACGYYGKAVGKPVPPVLMAIVRDLEPAELQRLTAKPPPLAPPPLNVPPAGA